MVNAWQPSAPARSANIHLAALPYCCVVVPWSSKVNISQEWEQGGGVERVGHVSARPALATDTLCALGPLSFHQLQFLQGAHFTGLLS